MAFSDFDIMSRCKKIFNHLADVTDVAIDNVNNAVSAAKSVIDTINTNVNSIKSYTTTNNTASETGVLSQKLAWLINVNKAHGSVERTSAGSQSWTCPTGVYFVYVIACGGCGGGGGGGRGTSDAGSSYDEYGGAGGGGGSGSVSQIVYALCAVTPGKSYNLVVGAGGAAGNGGKANNTSMTDPTDGGDGSESNFGNMVYAKGGNGGKKGSNGWTTDYSNQVPSSVGGAGGTVNNSYNGTMLKQFFINFVASVAGNKGENSGRYYYNSEGAKQAAGGSSVSNGIKKSGAGGAGGLNWLPWGDGMPANEPLLNGSNGAAGDTGYVKIIW